MTIEADQVAEIAAQVWSTLLERDLVQMRPTSVEGSMGAQVNIEGAFAGKVTIRLSPDFASQLAAQLFAMPEGDVDDDLVRDAIGELANIIAGNIKALLPTPSHLGLPAPSDDASGEVVAEVTLACGDHFVTVALEQSPSDKPGAPSSGADR
ncbi:MAG: chemotaxis protein CheX [Acidimicrobiales bacterium]|jgi:chemotaxis protein CheY-P-specific phosphatase CheC